MQTPLQNNGCEISPAVLSAEQQRDLLNALGPVPSAGRRGMLASPPVSALANSPALLGIVRERLGDIAQPVRAILFDKSPGANWLVPWHQDLSIAVVARVEVPGVGPWSMKDSIPHVQPPVAVLDQMLTLRLHLDDCDETNGALQVIPGSHRLGRLDAQQIRELRESRPAELCRARAGDALLMRPLLLHASGHSQSDRHRRVLHIEYAACTLPEPLRWHEAA